MIRKAFRVELTAGNELIIAETNDGEGVDLIIRKCGKEIAKVFGDRSQWRDAIVALEEAIS